MVKRRSPPPPADPKYRSIFEHSAVSLWEEDISALRKRLSGLRRPRGFKLRAYAAEHPEFVQEAVGLIEVTDVNQASLRMFAARDKKQLLGPLNIVLVTVSRAALLETIVAVDEGRNEVESESDALSLDGRKLSLIVKTHIPPADVAYPSMLVSLIDITDRKAAEKRARDNEYLLRSIINSSPDSIFVKDTSLRMVLCNTALARAIGKEPEETYGKTDIENGWNPDLVKGKPGAGIPGWEKDDLAALAGETVQVSSEPTEVDKGLRYYDTVKFPLRDETGAVTGLVGIGRDVTERRRAESALAQERHLFNMLMETIPDSIYFKDLDSRFTRVSTSHAKKRGIEDPALEVGKTDADFTGTAHWLKASEDERRIIRTGEPMVDKEERVAYPDRPDAWFLTTKMPLQDPSGKIVGTFGISRDITRRKQVEADLAKERYFLTTLMENLPDYIYIKDSASRFIRMSVSHARVLGLRHPSEAVGKTDFDFYREDHARKAFDDEKRVMQTGVPIIDVEERETYPNRPDTWALTTKMPLRDADGSIIGTFGITHDVTERKKLQEKNEQLAALVEFADDAIVALDMDRRITTWNKGAERVYGYTAEEMIAAPTSILIPPELEDEARLIRQRILRGEQVEHFETTRLRRDGTRITVALSLFAIRDAAGGIAGLASVARDITQQKAIEARLNRARRLEGLATLAGGVAHQFNNINTAVKGYLDLLKMEEGLQGRQRTYLEAASASVEKAVDITDRLLALTQPSGVAVSSVRLEDLARSVLDANAARIQEDGVQLVLLLEQAPAVEGSESRLRFVLSSLVGNALDSLVDRPSPGSPCGRAARATAPSLKSRTPVAGSRPRTSPGSSRRSSLEKANGRRRALPSGS